MVGLPKNKSSIKIGGLFTKVILEAKNEAQMSIIVEKAKEAGMVENRDFFSIFHLKLSLRFHPMILN